MSGSTAGFLWVDFKFWILFYWFCSSPVFIFFLIPYFKILFSQEIVHFVCIFFIELPFEITNHFWICNQIAFVISNIVCIIFKNSNPCVRCFICLFYQSFPKNRFFIKFIFSIVCLPFLLFLLLLLSSSFFLWVYSVMLCCCMFNSLISSLTSSNKSM